MEFLVKGSLSIYNEEGVLMSTAFDIYHNVENIEEARRLLALRVLHEAIISEASKDLGVEKSEFGEYDFGLHGKDFLILLKEGCVTLGYKKLKFEDVYGCTQDEYDEIYGD